MTCRQKCGQQFSIGGTLGFFTSGEAKMDDLLPPAEFPQVPANETYRAERDALLSAIIREAFGGWTTHGQFVMREFASKATNLGWDIYWFETKEDANECVLKSALAAKKEAE